MSTFRKPEWCIPPVEPYCLEVLKDDEVIEVIRLNKGCFMFGRNADQVDYVLNHSSCSRAHAVLLYNPNVQRFFLQDLKTANGTFVEGSKRPLDENMRNIPLEVKFHFGASTRMFRIVEKTDSKLEISASIREDDNDSVSGEFEELTRLNTTQNSNITFDQSMEGSRAVPSGPTARRKVRFNDTVDFINSHEGRTDIGQFGDLVRTKFTPVLNPEDPADCQPAQKRQRRLSDESPI